MNTLNVNHRVLTELDRVEQDLDVRVLYACESGSRAWGFESKDSDYDVRFLYVHRRDWYLSVDSRRDVVERPISDDLDVSGWDLRKALGLLRKSNPSLFEWMRSPLVYRADSAFTADFNVLAAQFYSAERCFAHYLHLAQGQWLRYLKGLSEVRLKEYLYVFRPLLACRWVQRGHGPVPMRLADLMANVLPEKEVYQALSQLVERKRAADELAAEEPIEVLTDFLEAEMPRLNALKTEGSTAPHSEALDKFFLRYLEN
jgi:predicted nucleotidyltransferase